MLGGLETADIEMEKGQRRYCYNYNSVNRPVGASGEPKEPHPPKDIAASHIQ